MITLPTGQLPLKMKSLFPILGLSFLSLTLTNCSLSPEQIASRIEPSIVKLFYRNEPGHGTGFFVPGEKGLCTVEETTVKILKVANRESEGWLRWEDAKNFSCQDLGTIDKLWGKYSNGKFGFSVQKQIYQGMGGSKEFNWDDYKRVGRQVGWRKGGKWLNYSELTFSEKHYTGHLPSRAGIWEWDEPSFFSRVETCKL